MTAEMTKQMDTFTADAQKAVDEGTAKMTESMEGFATFGQGSMEAMVASTKRAAKAAEEMNAEIAAYTKKSYEESLAAARDIAAVRTPTELFEKQSAFAKSAMDGYFSQMSRLGEMATTAAQSCMEPLAARATAATDLFRTDRA
jgi:phasin family protein